VTAAVTVGTAPTGVATRAICIGAGAFRIGNLARALHASDGLGMQVVLIWLFASGCAGAAWIAAYRMGYRRGVRDAITDDTIRANHRLNVD
jgi:hypothetical protein